ncbi:MAG TPA: hypothetical protein VFZ59_22085 [Verrucomicrobiae bacterium]|nr:hypothetical protein [Verrucomicrobiae bacterium]
MKSRPSLRHCFTVVCVVAFVAVAGTGAAAPTNIFFTNFDTNYSTALDLAGQNSWIKYGSGGNGIVSNFFAGQKHQAYVGFTPPQAGDDSLYVLRPIDFNPVAAGLPIVTFSVQMRVVDSSLTNTNYDYFRWSVYNMQSNRLFSIEFDNYELYVNYELSGPNELILTDVPFYNASNYLLTVTMNFASNRWSATLGNALIATNQPITTTGLQLSLGDIDAVWLVYDADAPGDNYMLFDNYRITAEALTVTPVAPAQMQFLGRTTQGWALLRTSGANGNRWAIDATTNFVNWTPLVTNTISSGSFDHVDMTAPPFARRFYGARLVP